jgi:hypothetical protein
LTSEHAFESTSEHEFRHIKVKAQTDARRRRRKRRRRRGFSVSQVLVLDST